MAEIAVRDGKTHVVAILCGIHPSLPITQWDLQVPYDELTLNPLRPFGHDNSKSAHTGVHGKPYDFKAHPRAPSGSLCVGFTPSDARHSRVIWRIILVHPLDITDVNDYLLYQQKT